MGLAPTSDMQGMLWAQWGEPELSHVCVFDHMVFFTVIMLMRCEGEVRNVNISYERRGGEIKMLLHVRGGEEHRNLER